MGRNGKIIITGKNVNIVVAADDCPELVVDKCTRVLWIKNKDGNPTPRLEAHSIYKIDKTGKIIVM